MNAVKMAEIIRKRVSDYKEAELINLLSGKDIWPPATPAGHMEMSKNQEQELDFIETEVHVRCEQIYKGILKLEKLMSRV